MLVPQEKAAQRQHKHVTIYGLQVCRRASSELLRFHISSYSVEKDLRMHGGNKASNTKNMQRFVLISLFYKLGKKGRKSWHSVFSTECRSFAIKLQQTHLENLLNHI